MKVATPLLRIGKKPKPSALPPLPQDKTADTDASAADPPPAKPPRSVALPMRRRLREWVRTLQRDPSVEEVASTERRERLLEELNRAVADAPDDIPIRDLIKRINQHHDD